MHIPQLPVPLAVGLNLLSCIGRTLATISARCKECPARLLAEGRRTPRAGDGAVETKQITGGGGVHGAGGSSLLGFDKTRRGLLSVEHGREAHPRSCARPTRQSLAQRLMPSPAEQVGPFSKTEAPATQCPEVCHSNMSTLTLASNAFNEGRDISLAFEPLVSLPMTGTKVKLQFKNTKSLRVFFLKNLQSKTVFIIISAMICVKVVASFQVRFLCRVSV